MNRLLYIEDNIEIGNWVKKELESHGYIVEWLINGNNIEQRIKNIDAVVLDIMLPGLDGFTLGKRLKELRPDIPIIFLSARSAIDDKVQGLQFADDYLTKPFHIEELLARLDILFRKYSRKEEIRLGDHLVVDNQALTIWNEEKQNEVILTGKQHQILMYFLNHPNQILPQEQIYEAVWQEAYIPGDKSLVVHIRHLRQKLEKDPAHPKIIETFKGIGYRVIL